MNETNTLLALGLIDALTQALMQAQRGQRDVTWEELDAQWARIREKRAQFEAQRPDAG